MFSESADQTLPKEIILKQRVEIQDIFDQGTFERRKWVTIVALKSDTEKVGFFVHRRCGNAVTRNRIKRWLREIYRTHKSHFTGYKIIFVVKRPLDFDYHDLLQAITDRPVSS